MIHRAVLLMCLTLVARGEPPIEYVEEARQAILEADIVARATIVAGPTRDGQAPLEAGARAFRCRLRVVDVLIGSGLTGHAEVDAAFAVPTLTTCVGGPPTDADHEAHRARWVGLFQPDTTWLFALERADGAVAWRVRAVHDATGPSLDDVVSKLGLRQDLEAIAQVLIAHPILDPYWHVDTIPARKPLIVLRSRVALPSLRATRFGAPVLVLDRDAIAARKAPAFLEIASIEVDGDHATARFGYAAEGVLVDATLVRESGVWAVATAVAKER